MFQNPPTGERRAGAVLRLIWLLVFALVAAAPGHAQKTDEVYLKNGDRITGNVKGLERGRLLVKTESMGSIYVEWSAVAQIISEKSLRLELTNGRRVLGTLDRSEGEQEINVASRFGETEGFPVESIVRMDPVYTDRSFWNSLDGKIGLGFSYTKGNDVGQFYFLGNAKYRKIDSEYEVNWNTILTSNGAASDSQRGNLGGTYRRFMGQRDFWTVLASVDRNDELGISSRLSGGGGLGRMLLQQTDYDLAIVGGAVATQENTGDADEDDANVEGILIGDFSIYRFSTPKTSLRTTLTFWPSLTDWGRVRSNFDITLGQEIIDDDLSISLTAYATHDNQPPTDAANGDYGIVTSLDYTF
jgi:hypothetical protein